MKSRPYGLSPAHYRPALLLACLLLALLAGCAAPYEVDEDGYAYISAASVDEIRWQRVDAGYGLSYKIPYGAPRQKSYFRPDDKYSIELGSYNLMLSNFGDFQTIYLLVYFWENEACADLNDILGMKGKTPEEWLGSPGEKSYAISRLLHNDHIQSNKEKLRYGEQRFIEIDGQTAHIISWHELFGSNKKFIVELQMPMPGYSLYIIFSTSYSPDNAGRAALDFARAFIDEFIAGFKIDSEARPFTQP